MRKYFNKIKAYIVAHKIISVLVVVALIFVGRYIYTKTISGTNESRYVTTTVSKGTIISSVSGSGQVSVSNQVDIKPNVSGAITYVAIKPGDKVWKGETLFSIDNTTARKAVRDAQIALESAQLDLTTAKATLDNTDANQQTSIANAYKVLLNSGIVAFPSNISDTATPPTITGIYTKNIEGSIEITTYPTNSSNGYFSLSGIASGIGAISTTTAQPIGDTGLYIKFPTITTESKWIITIPNTAASNYLSNYTAYQSALQSKNQTGSASDLSALNIKAKELAVTQRENALADAQQNLADYYVTAPFNGTVASVPSIEGLSVSSGTVLATIITNQKLATISLNEVDIAKIKLGNKATVTFDAIPDMTITGIIAQIDAVGTVSQGVVTYSVKISFDTQSDLIKPGMSVSTGIITDVHQNVLIVPTSAVKTQNGSSYVEVFPAELPIPLDGLQGSLSNTSPTRQTVETGISDDTEIEILSGLKENDVVVTKTITTATKTTATAPSLLTAVGGNTRGGATGGFRGTTTGR